MRKRIRGHGVMLALLLMAVIFVANGAPDAAACAMSIRVVPVTPTFSVFIRDRGKPVAKMEVELRASRGKADSITIAKQLSDADGRVVFHNVKPGNYTVKANRAWPTSWEAVEVKADGLGDQKIELEWPDGDVVGARSLAGILRGAFTSEGRSRVFNAALPVYSVWRNGSLAVADASDGRVVWQGTTDGQGTFSAGSLEPGLYILHLEETELSEPKSFFPLEGDIPVEVSPTADNERLDLELGMSSCGLGYTAGCPTERVLLDRACGVVQDVLGAAIPVAEILLYSLDVDRRIKGVSNARGDFDLDTLENGEYGLIVSRAGFSSFRAQIHSDGGKSERCDRPLRITLEMMGKCSHTYAETADAEKN